MSSHAATDASGAGKGSLHTYVTGFVLAVLLTAVPFALVMGHLLSATAALAVVFACAAVQIVVHLHYFLHLDTSSEERWNLTAFIFTVMVIVLIVGGSVWIMFNLRGRTMIDPAGAPVAARMHMPD
jgi:cytochrome o ubiquinol oxidase subunit IV